MGGRARHSVRAAIDIQAGKPSQLPLSQCFPLKKHIMQVPVFTTCYARRQRLQFIRPRRPWWTKSRCDSVCLRSRHFVAWLRRGLAHDAMAIQTTQLSQGFPQLNARSLLRSSICKCLFLQHVTPAASAPNSSGRVAPGGRSRAATPFACGAGTLWRCPAHRRTNAGEIPHLPHDSAFGLRISFGFRISNLGFWAKATPA